MSSDDGVAGDNRLFCFAGFDMRVSVAKDVLPFEHGLQSIMQLLRGEWLQEIVVGRQLGDGNHGLVTAFACDDDKGRRQRNQVPGPHFFKKLLPVPAVVEQVVAQNDVRRMFGHAPQRVCRAGCLCHLDHADGGEHCAQRGTAGRIGVDDDAGPVTEHRHRFAPERGIETTGVGTGRQTADLLKRGFAFLP